MYPNRASVKKASAVNLIAWQCYLPRPESPWQESIRRLILRRIGRLSEAEFAAAKQRLR